MDLIEKIRTLPTGAGCYLYKNAEGEVIYVGKAKNLRARVVTVEVYFAGGDQEAAVDDVDETVGEVAGEVRAEVGAAILAQAARDEDLGMAV